MKLVTQTVPELWGIISHIGVKDQDYSEARRIVLSNQIAFLGVIIPQLYNLFYVLYDFELLLPPIITNIIGSLVCCTIFPLNYRRYHKLAKIVITISPNIQILLLTYFLSTATGMHLLHIMMISFVFFLFSNESKLMIAINALIPVVMYIISFFLFTPENSPIVLNAAVLRTLYIILSLTVFVLIMIFFILFYAEIRHTELLLENEHKRSENLLLNILPGEIAQRLKTEPGVIAEMFPSVTILFADIVGFTGIASAITPDRLVKNLNDIFSKFDSLVDKYGLEKIKTIGDAYMVAGGIPVPMENHTEMMAHLALDMLQVVSSYELLGKQLSVRIGFHTGPVIAGVIGMKKFSYDIWGDAVNLASRLESHGDSGKIHVSEKVYNDLKDKFSFETRGNITVKGIGEIQTFFLSGIV